MKKNICLTILLSVFMLSLKAQWTTDTLQNTLVRDSVGTSETEPLSVTTSNGNTYVTWFESVSGNYQLRMQLLDSAGNKLWSQEGLVVSAFPQATYFVHYDLKVDHEDNAVVAFQDYRTGGNFNVVAYMISPIGTFLWGASGISLADDAAEEGLSPVIGVTASNNIIIAWNADSSSKQWVAYQKISSFGTLAWGATPRKIIDSTGVIRYSRPSVVPAGIDDFMMMYVQGTGTFGNAMRANHFDVNGNPVWPSSAQVSTKTISSYYFPEVISDMHGGLYVSFNTSNPVSLSLGDVYVQHVNASGGVWSATGTEAAVSTVNHKETRSIKFLDSRNEVWVLLKILDGGQTNTGISVQKFDTSGVVQLGAAAATVFPISIDYYEPFAFESTNDGMIIVHTVNSGFTAKLLKTIKINYSGLSLWTPAVSAVSSIVSVKSRISLGSFHNDQVIAVWKDERIDEGVYAQNIFNNGSVGPLAVPNEISIDENFNLFPNPSAEFPVIQFKGDKSGEALVSITNAFGKTICSHPVFLDASNGQLDLSKLIKQNFSSGIYFISISDNKMKEVKRWVKE